MKTGEQFLHQANPSFHNSQQVEGVADYLRQNGEKIPNEPTRKIEAYIGFLANQETVNDGILTGDQESIDRQIDAHIIKPENVPEGYFDLQRRIAREQGHGDIEITSTMRQQLVEAAQADQKASLTKWVEYLGGDDGSYPNWFKHYAWSSVVKLGAYDKEKGEFQKRSRGTTAPYPELNREGLAYVYDALHKETDDAKLKSLLKAGNFGKLYCHAVMEVTPDSPELLQNIEGSWKKYNQSHDPRTARRLSDSLQGHGTGWCTAGERTAASQLSAGDFYVFYSQDDDKKDTIPRVAVRMQHGTVAEVRGIKDGQELEPIFVDEVTDKLQNLPGGEAYIKKAADMKRLTEIEKQLGEGTFEPTRDSVAFLYELDEEIVGFGYDRDPRIDELKLKAVSYEVASLIEAAGKINTKIAQDMRDHLRIKDLEALVRADPFAELSDDDLRFAYRLDGPNRGNSFDFNDEEMTPSEMDHLRHGEDRDRLWDLIGEIFKKQLAAATAANQEVTREIGVEPLTDQQLAVAFAVKDKQWRENGVYAHVLNDLLDYSRYHTLVATPNIAAGESAIASIADKVAGELYSPYIYDELYKNNLYSATEWSGATGREMVRFSLVPDSQESFNLERYVAGADVKSATDQLKALHERQHDRPELKLHALSLLETLTYYSTLRAGGAAFKADDYLYAKTATRLIDMRPVNLNGVDRLPYLYFDSKGQVMLYVTEAEGSCPTRFALG